MKIEEVIEGLERTIKGKTELLEFYEDWDPEEQAYVGDLMQRVIQINLEELGRIKSDLEACIATIH